MFAGVHEHTYECVHVAHSSLRVGLSVRRSVRTRACTRACAHASRRGWACVSRCAWVGRGRRTYLADLLPLDVLLDRLADRKLDRALHDAAPVATQRHPTQTRCNAVPRVACNAAAGVRNAAARGHWQAAGRAGAGGAHLADLGQVSAGEALRRLREKVDVHVLPQPPPNRVRACVCVRARARVPWRQATCAGWP